ncbi:MAG: hypothetical protein JWN17_1555 [Frankiales bacterium]|nr:hypothetical protein [Frankiales bacterium]
MSVEQVLLADERALLEAFLDDSRAEVAALLDGATEEQARRRLVASETTLLALVKHVAFVERVWSLVALEGRSRASLGLPEAAEDSWVLDDADTVASVLADHAVAVGQARTAAAAFGLDDLVLHNRRSPMSLRWVYAHLLRELARHCGHGDVLREQLGLS